MVNLCKWLLLAVIVGCVVGGVSSLFANCLGAVTGFREGHTWTIFLLPFLGVVIVFLYQTFGQEDRGTHQVLSTIRSEDEVPLRSAPLIFISTMLTHLGGGSAGREGAAIQLGGSIGNQVGRWIHLDESDRHVIVMCGMSAAFAAVFGTPMAAAVFAMEVVSVGIMYYAALFPSVIAGLIASHLAAGFEVHAEAFEVLHIPELTIMNGVKMGLAAAGCAVVSILFCMVLRGMGGFYKRFLPNPYLRVLAAGTAVALISLLLGTSDYMGAGNGLIMKAGYRGGEIVPSFCIGATFGCVAGNILGISPSLCAAAGMAAVFCGVTNCPITSVLIAFELFGFEGVPYYLIAVSVSYAFSGYYSLYKTQTIVYSKYKAKYINRKAKS